jgi:hypothetical protein
MASFTTKRIFNRGGCIGIDFCYVINFGLTFGYSFDVNEISVITFKKLARR